MNVIYMKEKNNMKKNYLYESKELGQKINLDGETYNRFNQLIIAGPCTFGSYEEIRRIVKKLKKLDIKYIRAGVYKPRTNPYSFQGLGDKGIDILISIKKEFDIKIVVEVMTINQLKKYSKDIDIIQIGSRNMYNYSLLKEVGKIKKPVLLKRGISATYKEWLLAAEYILKEGNKNVILCERGIRGFDPEGTRNILDIQAIPYIKHNCKLPIIIDPSHASGLDYMVESMSKASLVAGADGLIIEVHDNPKESLCDSNQTINIDTLKKIINFKERIKKYEDKEYMG